MAGTTAFDVKAALFNLLSANATLLAMTNPSCDVTYGFGGKPDELPRLTVQVGEIVWDSEESTALGARKVDEKYSIAILIQSHNPGDDQTDANGRVKAVMQVIESLVRDERWSSPVSIWASGLVPQYVAEGTDPEGRGAILLLRLYISARI